MKIFLVFSLIFSLTAYAQQIDLKPSMPEAVYSSEELHLLESLSERHIKLLEKQKELEEKEKFLEEKETHLKKMQEELLAKNGRKNGQLSRIYMQMPSYKAAQLLDGLPENEVILILEEMPAVMVSRILDKMPIERSKSILRSMSKSTF